VPYGEDNFLFFDPDSGKFTLYNAPGLDFRDVSSLTKTGVEIVGGGLGAVWVCFGRVHWAGGGSNRTDRRCYWRWHRTEFGARAFDTSTGVFGGRERAPKPLIEEFTETGVRVGLASTGQAAGPLIAEGGKRVLTGVSPTARNAASDLIAKFESLGIEPVGAAIGRKGMLGRAGAGLEQRLAAGPIMQKQAERVVVQLDERVARYFFQNGANANCQ
jgi:hypothetical protein